MIRFKLRPALLAVFLFFTVCGSLLAWRFFLRRSRPSSEAYFPQSAIGRQAPCPGKEETINLLHDDYLPGIFPEMEPHAEIRAVRVTWNWYACHRPQAGEAALVRISRDLPPRVKMVRAVPGDELALRVDAASGRWNLLVNGDPVLDFRKSPYAFGAPGIAPPIARYLETHGHSLGADEVVVFSTRSPGEFDSGLFGVLGVADLVAKDAP